jgi:hypothetical protein
LEPENQHDIARTSQTPVLIALILPVSSFHLQKNKKQDGERREIRIRYTLITLKILITNHGGKRKNNHEGEVEPEVRGAQRGSTPGTKKMPDTIR